MIKISPSILAADFANLGESARRAEQAGVDYLHMDVMDGHFVPNITFGIDVIKAVRAACNVPLDVHLMISEPLRYIEDFVRAGAHILTIHVEACEDMAATLSAIRAAGAKAALSIKPATPAESILPYLELLDMILVMSVEPGFTGQGFMPESVAKIAAVKRIIDEAGVAIPIQVDGGISSMNVGAVVEAGASVIVAGAALFRVDDMAAAVQEMREKANSHFGL